MNTFDVTNYNKACTEISRFEMIMTCFLNNRDKPNLMVGGYDRYLLLSNSTLDSAMQKRMADAVKIYLSTGALVACFCEALVAFSTGRLEEISSSLTEDAAGLTNIMMPLKKGKQSRLIVNSIIDQISGFVMPRKLELRELPITTGSSCLLTRPWLIGPLDRFIARPDHAQLQNGGAE